MSNSKIYYDEESNMVWIKVKDGSEERFEEILPGVNVEYNAQGEVIGIEFLDASLLFKPSTQTLGTKENIEELSPLLSPSSYLSTYNLINTSSAFNTPIISL